MSVRLRPVLLGLLLFLGGAVVALATEHALLLHGVIGWHQDERPATIPHHAVISDLEATLHLSPAQAESLDVILLRHQPLVDSAWRGIHRHLEAAMDSVHRQVEAVLDSSQIVAFRRWARRQHDLPGAGATMPH